MDCDHWVCWSPDIDSVMLLFKHQHPAASHQAFYILYTGAQADTLTLRRPYVRRHLALLLKLQDDLDPNSQDEPLNESEKYIIDLFAILKKSS